MFNPLRDIDWNPDQVKRRAFAISLIVGFPSIALVALGIGYLRQGAWHTAAALAIAGGGAGAGVLFLLVPAIVRPFYVAWYVLAGCIGLVVGNVLMAVVFYGLVGSIGLFRRALGRSAIAKSIDRTKPSYWIEAGPPPPPERYYRQF